MMPLVLASDTGITVKTYSNHSVTLNVLNTDDGSLYQSFENNTDEAGLMTVTFSGSVNKITFSVIVRNGGSIVKMKKFGNYSAGSPILLDINAEEPAAPVVVAANQANQSNQTSANQTIQTITGNVANTNISSNESANITSKSNNITEQKSGETGEKFKVPSWAYYIVLGIIGLVALVFIGKGLIGTARENGWSFSKLTSFMPRSSPKLLSAGASTKLNKIDREILSAEKKIMDAQSEIERIKNRKQRVVDAERRFEEAKKELDKIKRKY